MQKINNIFHFSKGVITELTYVGEHPEYRETSVWMETKGFQSVNVLNSDLRTKYMYSDCKYDMMVRKKEWLDSQKKELDIWFDNNSK